MPVVILLLTIVALAVLPQALINLSMFVEWIIVTVFRVVGIIGSIGFITWLVLR